MNKHPPPSHSRTSASHRGGTATGSLPSVLALASVCACVCCARTCACALARLVWHAYITIQREAAAHSTRYAASIYSPEVAPNSTRRPKLLCLHALSLFLHGKLGNIGKREQQRVQQGLLEQQP
eukprot:scaffold91666_cov20-Tisochrysis_lutea.AAC.1